MDRRGFLGGLIATASGLYLPYEPERIYSLPSRRFLMEEAVLKKMLDSRMILSEKESIQREEIRKWNDYALGSMDRLISKHLAFFRHYCENQSVHRQRVLAQKIRWVSLRCD